MIRALSRWANRHLVWWHRSRGHRVLVGVNLLNPTGTYYRCDRCCMVWSRSWL